MDTEREAELTWFKAELDSVELKLKAPPGPISSTDTPEEQAAERKRLEDERKRLEAERTRLDERIGDGGGDPDPSSGPSCRVRSTGTANWWPGKRPTPSSRRQRRTPIGSSCSPPNGIELEAAKLRNDQLDQEMRAASRRTRTSRTGRSLAKLRPRTRSSACAR